VDELKEIKSIHERELERLKATINQLEEDKVCA